MEQNDRIRPSIKIHFTKDLKRLSDPILSILHKTFSYKKLYESDFQFSKIYFKICE